MGVGFMVACLLPSARLIDAITSSKSKLVQLITSSISLRSRRSDSEYASKHEEEEKGFERVREREWQHSRSQCSEDLGSLEAEVRQYSAA